MEKRLTNAGGKRRRGATLHGDLSTFLRAINTDVNVPAALPTHTWERVCSPLAVGNQDLASPFMVKVCPYLFGRLFTVCQQKDMIW